MKNSGRFWLTNLTGAYADGAILFPLLAALSIKGGFSSLALLASAGLAYWVAGLLFRVPMSIQPLKSVAIGSLAMGASSQEVQIAGLLLAIACLALSFLKVNELAGKVPPVLVQGLQMSLGLLLILQGLKCDSGPGVFLLTACMLASPRFVGIPALGLFATAGLLWAALHSPDSVHVPAHAHALQGLQNSPLKLPLPRMSIVTSLVLPQLALTLANSVIGTRDVAQRYFGDRASRVTVRRLLCSIGIGNVICSAWGGLPFCHGSGGLTAHARGGATHWAANAIMGSTLLVFAVIQYSRSQWTLQYPVALMASLLVTTGAFHLTLAKPAWTNPSDRISLLTMGSVALLTQNLLWVLFVGIGVESMLKLNDWRTQKERGLAS